jgi:hypothetical protein
MGFVSTNGRCVRWALLRLESWVPPCILIIGRSRLHEVVPVNPSSVAPDRFFALSPSRLAFLFALGSWYDDGSVPTGAHGGGGTNVEGAERFRLGPVLAEEEKQPRRTQN